MRVSSRACALVAAVHLGVFAPLGCLSGTPQFTLRSQVLAGKELRVILETSTTYRRFDSSSRKTASAKGWVITVDLSKEGPIAERSRVIGPLWDVANERSSLSFDAGAHFTKEDVAAARATPFIDLGAALTTYDAPTGELFNVRSGEYVPKKFAVSAVIGRQFTANQRLRRRWLGGYCFFGTLAPFFLAFDRPIAIACLRLFTRLCDLPLVSVPFFFR